MLNKLYKNYLIEQNIEEKQIIQFAFDNQEDILKLDKYLPREETLKYGPRKNYVVNAKKFLLYINDLTIDNIDYYILLDEIQLLDNFVITLNGLLNHANFDIYVTGSNSRTLSKDIITEFRVNSSGATPTIYSCINNECDYVHLGVCYSKNDGGAKQDKYIQLAADNYKVYIILYKENENKIEEFKEEHCIDTQKEL